MTSDCHVTKNHLSEQFNASANHSDMPSRWYEQPLFGIHGFFDHCHNIFVDIFRQTGADGVVSLHLLAASSCSKSKDSAIRRVVLGGGVCLRHIVLAIRCRMPLTKPYPAWLVLWLPIGFLLSINLPHDIQRCTEGHDPT